MEPGCRPLSAGSAGRLRQRMGPGLPAPACQRPPPAQRPCLPCGRLPGTLSLLPLGCHLSRSRSLRPPLTVALGSCSPHAGRWLECLGRRPAHPPQPDLPHAVRRRQEDAQEEESEPVLQDNGEPQTVRGRRGVGRKEGKRFTRTEGEDGALRGTPCVCYARGAPQGGAGTPPGGDRDQKAQSAVLLVGGGRP